MKIPIIRNEQQDLSPAPSVARHDGPATGVRGWMSRHCQTLYSGVLGLTDVCVVLFDRVAWRVAPPATISAVFVDKTR